jgi:hypothetical protein
LLAARCRSAGGGRKKRRSGAEMAWLCLRRSPPLLPKLIGSVRLLVKAPAYLIKLKHADMLLAEQVMMAHMVASRLLEVEDFIFTDWRIRVYGWSIVIAYVLALAWTVFELHTWPFLPNGNPRCIDFGWIWLSGVFAVDKGVARIFDYSAWSAVQAAFYDPADCPNFNRFYYPPTFLFFTYPLGFMPYVSSLVAWVSASFFVYQAAIYAIISRRAALVAAATPCFVLFNIYFGHTGFLTAGFIGLSLALMERRPWLSGIFLALLTYKPHFGLLFPIALLASRNWRVIGATLAATTVLGVLAATVFGSGGWISFMYSLADRNAGLGSAPGIELRLESVFGLFHWVGASAWVSWGAQAAVSSVVVIAIWLLWAKPISYNLKAAALCSGSLLVSPYSISYDLCILSIAAAFFVREGLSRGFLSGDRIAILVCWFLSFLIMFPIGPAICAILLLLIARRTPVGAVLRFSPHKP